MNRCESITSQTIVRHYKLESREGDGMKGGKGNTFSTSLNKSFFLSFFFSPRLLRKSINRNLLLKIREKGGQTSECVRAIVHAMLIDIHVVGRRVTKWKMILLTRHKTMNKRECSM